MVTMLVFHSFMTLPVYLDGTRLYVYHKWEGIRKRTGPARGDILVLAYRLRTEESLNCLSQVPVRNLKRAPPPPHPSTNR